MNHQVPANTMSNAFATALGTTPTVFDFDLIGTFKGLSSHEFGSRLLGKVAFACDAYIGIAIQRALSAMRNSHELEGTASWDSYQAFLHYAAGIAASEDTMAEAGMDVTPLREQLQSLFNVRTECHDILLERSGSHQVPSIAEFMAKPRLRRDDADTVMKLSSVFRAQATNDDGVIDVALEQELGNVYASKAAFEKKEQLKWDIQRGELAAMFWNAFNLKEGAQVRVYEEAPVHALRVDDSTVKLDAQDVIARSMNRTGEFSPVDPFGDLDAEYQYKLLHGGLRYVANTLTDGAKDRKVQYQELAKWSLESRPLVKSLKAALEHPKFADIG